MRMLHSKATRRLGDFCLFSVIFLVITTSIVALPRPAHAVSCGTVARFYAVGQNSETYSKYGVSTTQTIYTQTICGSGGSTGSVVANFVAVTGIAGDFMAVGYYKGLGGDGSTWTGSNQDFYWDGYTCSIFGCYYTFSDVSKGTGTYPSAGDQIYFQLQGSLNNGNHYWYVTITLSGSYTLNVNQIHGPGDYGSSSTAQMESHNNVNSGYGYYWSLQNLKQTGSNNWSWTTWASSAGARSPNDNTNPYCFTKYSDSAYYMYTTTGSC